MTVKIVTDSASDIALELAQRLGITIVPLYIRFGDKTYRDQVDIGADEFYHELETSHFHPITSAPSPGDFIKVFKKLARETNEILSLLGSILNVKPLITIQDGELYPVGLARTRGKGIERLCEFVRSALPIQDLAIIHSTTPNDAQVLAERISSFLPQIRPRIAKLGPALGTHSGPGTLIVALRKGRESALVTS